MSPLKNLRAISKDFLVGESFWSPETSTHQPSLLGYMSELKKEHSADIKLLQVIQNITVLCPKDQLNYVQRRSYFWKQQQNYVQVKTQYDKHTAQHKKLLVLTEAKTPQQKDSSPVGNEWRLSLRSVLRSFGFSVGGRQDQTLELRLHINRRRAMSITIAI